MPIRSQLSLFVPPDVGAVIEAVRRRVDPAQSRLIPAHVTLCREDELAGLGVVELEARIRLAPPGPLTLQFGAPERFQEHGMLLPCRSGTAAFQSLRALLLGTQRVRPHTPHLTLAHPRNPRVSANELSSAASLRDGLTITFGEVRLIEQVGGAPWIVRGTFPLLAARGDRA